MLDCSDSIEFHVPPPSIKPVCSFHKGSLSLIPLENNVTVVFSSLILSSYFEVATRLVCFGDQNHVFFQKTDFFMKLAEHSHYCISP